MLRLTFDPRSAWKEEQLRPSLVGFRMKNSSERRLSGIFLGRKVNIGNICPPFAELILARNTAVRSERERNYGDEEAATAWCGLTPKDDGRR